MRLIDRDLKIGYIAMSLGMQMARLIEGGRVWSYPVSKSYAVTCGEITGATAVLQIVDWKARAHLLGCAGDGLVARLEETDGAGGDSGGEAL